MKNFTDEDIREGKLCKAYGHCSGCLTERKTWCCACRKKLRYPAALKVRKVKKV